MNKQKDRISHKTTALDRDSAGEGREPDKKAEVGISPSQHPEGI